MKGSWSVSDISHVEELEKSIIFENTISYLLYRPISWAALHLDVLQFVLLFSNSNRCYHNCSKNE